MEDLFNSVALFDLIFLLIMIYIIFQCAMRGFTLSLISFMKYVLALILTIYLVPKFQPWVSEYIDSPFINNIGLGILIFIISLFVTVMIGKVFRSSMKWTGFGPMDKTFGLLFGFFKGYVVSVCIFTVINWFYPFNNWNIDVNKSISFNFIKNGSLILIDEFPKYEDLENTKEKIDKI
jgi:membrane protein required for colicin V production|tara:strand:- start:84 stop:617 length:534 start_codon:yes stop_codon:yes gene_type:complete